MKLPIGIQTFKKIREENFIYIDKTQEALDLIENYNYIFLSRPRRFGKSLFLDTLKNIFEGRKELFEGLYIHDKYDFTPHPVIKIDWAGNFKTLENTKNVALEILKENQKRLGITCENNNPDMCFRELIQSAYEKYGQKVVVLIDEYDKPILDNIENPQRAVENRDFLRGMYIQLKANDEFIRFAFLTGISKFSKASIFSGLNNIVDISLMPKYGNICGYTHENLQTDFAEYAKDFDLQRVKAWYNGYYFLKDRIYNPFDILRLFDSGMFRNYWWESGNPYFLIELLKKGDYFIPSLENLSVSEDLINTFEVDHIKLEVLLYQAGYLTIKEVETYEEFEMTSFHLGVPNKEVQISLNTLFFTYLTDQDIYPQKKIEVLKALKAGNLQSFEAHLKALFASIPYNHYVNNTISHFEGYYASVIYAYLASLGFEIVAEDVTSKGRINLTLKVDEKIYIIEFKVGEGDALEQIKQKKYYEKYLSNPTIYLVGILFDEKERNIARFAWEEVNSEK